ncbi:hypothetical protein J8273_8768 [Carpediemonas membranifera]|uniref:Uncharacterized protein n=1 Tax=Carpediemonas membranifera TaxID=201153 RepID=A0A8J6AP40_9EUKA|nr:hypothetical protein J8273_8768 [Carpediemonas membranifera]|eukprot:KAG9389476.1 hypothetical protein J8273_8768 [Carpediemonas membranifera]
MDPYAQYYGNAMGSSNQYSNPYGATAAAPPPPDPSPYGFQYDDIATGYSQYEQSQQQQAPSYTAPLSSDSDRLIPPFPEPSYQPEPSTCNPPQFTNVGATSSISVEIHNPSVARQVRYRRLNKSNRIVSVVASALLACVIVGSFIAYAASRYFLGRQFFPLFFSFALGIMFIFVGASCILIETRTLRFLEVKQRRLSLIFVLLAGFIIGGGILLVIAWLI